VPLNLFVMKTKLLLSFLLFPFSFLLSPCFAQVPQGFNYQAIARDGSGNILANQALPVKIDIQTSLTGGTLIYEELFASVTSNQFGLISLVVGTGTQTGGSAASFSAIDWKAQTLYLKTIIQYPGTTWTTMGTSQIWGVPYSLVSNETVTKQTLSLAGTDLSISGGNSVSLVSGTNQWQTDGTNVYRLTGKVGIGTITPTYLLDVNGYAIINSNIFNPGGMELGITPNLTGNRYSGIDFHGDDTYTDYALRILRYNTGPNAMSGIVHRGTGEFRIGTQDAGFLTLFTNSSERLRVTADGNVGIGTASPNSLFNPYMTIGDALNSTSEIMDLTLKPTGNTDYLRFYGIRKVAGTNWSDVSLRIQQRVDATDMGYIEFNPGTSGYDLAFGTNNVERLRINQSGNVGIGTKTPTSKVVIQPDASWDDNTPLFEVRNKFGYPVLAVYNNGIRVLVDNTIGKGAKGGFSVGGYDQTKAGKTVDFMNITPDSIRFNINNDNTKGKKGGFAVGGYDATKKGPINQDFMYITPQTSDNGQYNTFLGYGSGHSMTTGKENVILGVSAGYNNTTGGQNVFVGKCAGYYNKTGYYNVIIGWSDLSKYPWTAPTDLGDANTLIGYSTSIGVTGNENTILGNLAGKSLTTGSYNCLIGSYAGVNQTGGLGNVMIGEDAGTNSTSDENVFVGASAGWSVTTGKNNIALGTDAQVPTATNSNQIRLGDTRITYAGIQVAWTVTSDIKWKESIEDLTLGLNIVKGLKPVDYIRKNNIAGTREAGFIAQDVQKLFSNMGINNSGLLSVGNDGSLELRYNDFIPILTKAIQEQQQQIESQKQENQQLKAELQAMKERLDRIEGTMAGK
jgi:trimeric autotransporter adhesin